jgi:hypothetical protein
MFFCYYFMTISFCMYVHTVQVSTLKYVCMYIHTYCVHKNAIIDCILAFLMCVCMYVQGIRCMYVCIVSYYSILYIIYVYSVIKDVLRTILECKANCDVMYWYCMYIYVLRSISFIHKFIHIVNTCIKMIIHIHYVHK